MSGESKLAKNLNARYVVYILAVPIIIFYTLALTGCLSNSPGIPSIYLVTIKSANGTHGLDDDLVVRVGYFGMCAGTSGPNLTCSPTRGPSATQLASSLLSASNNNTSTLFVLATVLQSQIFPFFLAIAGSIFFLALLFVLILERDIKRPTPGPKAVKRRNILGKASKNLVWMSVALALAASLGTHQAVATLQLLFETVKGEVIINYGMTLLTLQWLTVGFSIVFALGISAVCHRKGGPSDTAA